MNRASFLKHVPPPKNERWCYEPLDELDWENMVIEAELPMFIEQNDLREQANKLSAYVLRMSEEIRRLRHKCNEEVWFSCSSTPEDDQKEKEKCQKT